MIDRVLVGGLMLLLVTTAVAVVYAKHRARGLFGEIQRLERELDHIEVEWGKLQLEQNTLAELGRVQKFANEELGMVIPEKIFSLSTMR